MIGESRGDESGAGNSREHVEFTLRRDTSSNREYNQFLVCGSLFECPSKYLPIKPIGKGAYGVVCSARNLDNSEKVAIKKITSAFDNVVDAKRTLREIKLLRHLSHENIIQIKDMIPPVSRAHFKDLYVVYELMDTDLHQIIRSPQPLSDDHCQYFLYQVLRGLKYIHSTAILHRDLKPSNLLVNANCDLKICDFGLARTSDEKEFMTEYVVTRWYRAPELLLSCSEYSSSIDVWSVGCIFAELLGRKAIFPGKDYVHQLNLITKVIGSPADEELEFITSEKAKRYIRSLPKNERLDFGKFWPNANKQAVDLIDKMLVFDPRRRITVEEALDHPYLASLHDLSDEPVCTQAFEFNFDSEHLTPDAVRDLIIQDMEGFHPGLAHSLQLAAQQALTPAASPPQQPPPASPSHSQPPPPQHQQHHHMPPGTMLPPHQLAGPAAIPSSMSPPPPQQQQQQQRMYQVPSEQFAHPGAAAPRMQMAMPMPMHHMGPPPPAGSPGHPPPGGPAPPPPPHHHMGHGMAPSALQVPRQAPPPTAYPFALLPQQQQQQQQSNLPMVGLQPGQHRPNGGLPQQQQQQQQQQQGVGRTGSPQQPQLPGQQPSLHRTY